MSVEMWLGIWLSNLASVEGALVDVEAHPTQPAALTAVLDDSQKLATALAQSPIATHTAASASLVQTIRDALNALSQGELLHDPELFNRFAQAFRVLRDAARRVTSGAAEPKSVVETDVSLRAWLAASKRVRSSAS